MTQADPNGLPDRIHTPNGILNVQSVDVDSSSNTDIITEEVVGGDVRVTLNISQVTTTAGAGAEWAYFRFANPLYRSALGVSCVRPAARSLCHRS